MKHLSTRHAAERIGNAVTRTIVERVDDTKFMQHHMVSGYSGEQQDQIEHAHPYGYVSVVQKPTGTGTQRMGAEGFMGFMGGGRSHGVVFMAGDRRFRLYKLADGEVAMHDDQGQQVHFKRDGIYGSVPNSKKIKLQIMDDDQLPRDSGAKLGQLQQATRPAAINVVLDKNQMVVNHPNGLVYFNCRAFSVNASADIKAVAGGMVGMQAGDKAVLKSNGQLFLSSASKINAKSPLNLVDPDWTNGAVDAPSISVP